MFAVVQEMDKIGIKPKKIELPEDSTDDSRDNLDKLPGNNKVEEKFHRKNRYGVFGDNNWEKMVDLYYKNPNYKKPDTKKFHIEPYNERFDEINDQMLNFVNLAGKPANKSKPILEHDLKVEDYEDEFNEEHVKYEESLKNQKPVRSRIYSKEPDPKIKNLPGIVNSQKRINEVTSLHVKRRTDAALTIQRLYRGYKGRIDFKRFLQKKNIQDAEDYGYFEV